MSILTVDVSEPESVPPSKEELLEAIDKEMAEFNIFFELGLKQSPPTPMERAYLKTFLVWKLLGPDQMVK